MSIKNKSLGKGLESIFLENDIISQKHSVILDINEIKPNESQVRKCFDQNLLLDLSRSIILHGILQPLIVKPCKDLSYEIVAGERRFRASQIAGIQKIPVFIVDNDDRRNASISLVENLQRENLNPIDEAMGFKDLILKFNYTQKEISKEVGKSRSLIANSLRLLTLPKEVINSIKEKQISSAHARTLLSLKNKDKMIKMVEIVIKKGLSVRELEKACKKGLEEKIKKKKIPFFCDIEVFLKNHLNRKIKITNIKKNKGMLQIEFKNKEDLENIINVLKEHNPK